ncbi:hypothetical protein [Vagococcus silagei]|uniref:Uncharacterized protein n=1 Tax=Vagococcus silagei TaxID=2508885 RepID=A0A4S3B682_9ENTE|nr:hypothetical protein [Vagococcus silagei]THB61223.1 hypothetical protein ESZ54_05620 [Vagococcus silagei]
MSKSENIEFICMKLQGLTKLNFQVHLGRVLEEFYVYKGLTYEMPSPNGGDDKNDGWVEEEKLFYQIYAPSQLRESLPKDMKNKFSEDLEELLNKLKTGKWNGDIKQFIFLVNTFDDNLPKDSERFYDTKVEELKKKTGFEFTYKVSNLSFVKRLLWEIDDLNVFEIIKSSLNITMGNPIASMSNQTMYHFLTQLGNQIMSSTIMASTGTGYSRISTQRKIDINDLGDMREELNFIIEKLYVIEEAVAAMNKSTDTSELFENIVKFVISAYNILSRDLEGIELFDALCKEISKHCDQELIVDIPTKYLIVYVFDHCDIFKKEEVPNNANT